MPADAATRRLLASEPFARCRRKAESIARDDNMLRVLLTEVEMKVIESEFLRAKPTAVNIDIAAAVVEAFLESGEPYASLDAARSARLRLVIAGLEYLVMEHDVVPDAGPDGLVDDLTVVRWVARVAAGAEGHPVDELGD